MIQWIISFSHYGVAGGEKVTFYHYIRTNIVTPHSHRILPSVALGEIITDAESDSTILTLKNVGENLYRTLTQKEIDNARQTSDSSITENES